MTDRNSLSTTLTPTLLSVLRIVTAFLFIAHGTQKLFNYPATPGGAAEIASLVGVAGVLEFFGGILLLLGLFTKPAAFLLSGMMAVAYFMFHAAGGFLPLVNQGETAVLYCFIFLFLAAAGGGPLSIDALITRSNRLPEPAAA